MKITEYINAKFNGNKAAFARSQNVRPQQVTTWVNMGCIVIDNTLYSPRRELKNEEIK